jgi:hypothetical protein
MSTRSTGLLAGPRRLILIQSGKYDYAELDLTRPFQLVGVNGLGKTALISTLQYLYLDDQRDMRFGQHTTDESRRFYFKGEASFILYECETSLGTITLGARGLGPAESYKLQRFAWEGSYDREDFIGQDNRPRTWDDVSKILAAKGLNVIADNIELRRLLGAVDEDTAQSWGLVPLADARDYPRFRQTFQRLLQLRDLRQDDLKQLLADCAKLSATEREIDLAKDFEKDLGQITRDRAEVALLRKVEPQVREVRGLYDQEIVARGIAYEFTRELQSRYAGYAAWFRTETDALYKVRNDALKAFNHLEVELESTQNEIKQLAGKRGVAIQWLENLTQAKQRFADFDRETEDHACKQLDAEITDLNLRLADLPKETQPILERQLAEKQTVKQQRESAVQKFGHLFITWLRERLPEESVARLGAIFDRRVLESVLDEQISIGDEAGLLRRLKVAVERCDARGYTDDVVSLEFAANAVTDARKLGQISGLQEEIRALTREIDRLARNIETLKNAQPFRERRDAAKKEYEIQLKRLADHKTYLEQLTQAPERQSELERLSGEISRREIRLVEIREAQTKAKSEGDIAIEKARKLADDDREITREARDMPAASGDDPGATPVSDQALSDAPKPLLELLKITRSRCDKARSVAQQLTDKIGLLDKDFVNPSFAYDATSAVMEKLRLLESEIYSLEERSQAIESRWRGVLTSAKRSFHMMLKSLGEVTKQAKKLTGELAKIEFSSIAEVRLEIVPHQAAVAEYERYAKDAGQPSLFDTNEEADRKLTQFNTLLQRRPRLVLNELFSLRCEVRRKDGQRNLYDDFDQVESTGTTIVLKVTLNLLVLRDLLAPGKARIPYYLDEVHALDRQNFNNILQLSERLGFIGIYAAPTAAVGPRRFVHLVPDSRGKLVVTTAHQKDIVRAPEDFASSDDTGALAHG